MSDRITKEWVPDTLEAFGATAQVRKGKEAEDMYYEWAKVAYDDCISHEGDQEKQNQGIDFTIFKKKWGPDGYTVEVKSCGRKKDFDIDNRPNGWLRHPEKISDRIVVVDIKNGWATDFRRKEMIDFIDNWTNIPPTQEKIIMDVFDERYPKNLLHRQNLLKEKHSLKNYIVKNPKVKAEE